MDTSSKNRLQEHCLKKRFPFPNYRISQQVGLQHELKFQAEVQVNGQCYNSVDFYLTKKQAEQAAARKALESIAQTDIESISTPSHITHVTTDDINPPPSYAEAIRVNPIDHLPSEYSDIDEYMSTTVGLFGGRVRKRWSPDSDGLYKFEIAGKYRSCDNIQGRHRSCTIYFMVDPIKRIHYQMCHHRNCSGFRSVPRTIPIRHQTSVHEGRHESSTEKVE